MKVKRQTYAEAKRIREEKEAAQQVCYLAVFEKKPHKKKLKLKLKL